MESPKVADSTTPARRHAVVACADDRHVSQAWIAPISQCMSGASTHCRNTGRFVEFQEIDCAGRVAPLDRKDRDRPAPSEEADIRNGDELLHPIFGHQADQPRRARAVLCGDLMKGETLPEDTRWAGLPASWRSWGAQQGWVDEPGVSAA